MFTKHPFNFKFWANTLIIWRFHWTSSLLDIFTEPTFYFIILRDVFLRRHVQQTSFWLDPFNKLSSDSKFSFDTIFRKHSFDLKFLINGFFKLFFERTFISLNLLLIWHFHWTSLSRYIFMPHIFEETEVLLNCIVIRLPFHSANSLGNGFAELSIGATFSSNLPGSTSILFSLTRILEAIGVVANRMQIVIIALALIECFINLNYN